MKHLYHQRDGHRSPKNILCRTKLDVRPYFSVWHYINNAWVYKDLVEDEEPWCPECVDKVPLYELAATEL